MNIENKIKAMGLELPTPGTPPAGRAGAVQVGNIPVSYTHLTLPTSDLV